MNTACGIQAVAPAKSNAIHRLSSTLCSESLLYCIEFHRAVRRTAVWRHAMCCTAIAYGAVLCAVLT
eukprot:3116360-Rhodomonas_salina.3